LDDKTYECFYKTWEWQDDMQKEIKINYELQDKRILRNARLAGEAKGQAEAAIKKAEAATTKTNKVIQDVSLWYDDIDHKLKKSEKIAKEISADLCSTKTKIRDSLRVRDEGCQRMLEEIKTIQQRMTAPASVRGDLQFIPQKYKMIDPNCVKNSGIYFSDEMRHFPHEFLKEFEDFFEGVGCSEAQKIMAFRAVILTKNKTQFKETIKNMSTYQEVRDQFLSFYWNIEAQNDAMIECRYNNVHVDDIKSMAVHMIRWARTLSYRTYHYDSEVIRVLTNKAPLEYRSMITQPGQTIDQFIEKLRVLSKIDVDPKNEVPYVIGKRPQVTVQQQKLPWTPAAQSAQNPTNTNKIRVPVYAKTPEKPSTSTSEESSKTAEIKTESGVQKGPNGEIIKKKFKPKSPSTGQVIPVHHLEYDPETDQYYELSDTEEEIPPMNVQALGILTDILSNPNADPLDMQMLTGALVNLAKANSQAGNGSH
ncbi:unnamed protein product, partial [Allacma fusca]